MKKSYVSLLIMIFLSVFLMSGCDSFIPSTPDVEYDEENTELAYIRVIPFKKEMSINQSQIFEVKAYNSDDKLIAMNPSKVEKWVAVQSCGIGNVEGNIFPTKGSLQTTFTPYEAGSFKVHIKYGEIWSYANVEVY